VNDCDPQNGQHIFIAESPIEDGDSVMFACKCGETTVPGKRVESGWILHFPGKPISYGA
jgi:hypothetical protein